MIWDGKIKADCGFAADLPCGNDAQYELDKGMLMAKKALKIMGIVILLLLIVWFLQPIFRYGLNVGNYFGIVVCGMGILIILFYKRPAAAGGVKKAVMRLFTCCYILGLAWCGYLSVLMFSAQDNPPPENTNLIILGAQVYSENSMSLSLSQRVDKAEEYLLQNPQALCIATGSQGPNEPCTEAIVQKNYLVKNGIDENRVYLEEDSANTRENLRNSLVIAKENGMTNEFAIVTQSFHMYRAQQLARQEGIVAYSLVTETEPLLFSGYYGRELMSLTKWYLESLFTERNVAVE